MADTKRQKVRVWDLPVRLFHWTLVLLLVVSYLSGRAGGGWMDLHFWSGYAILTLLLFRLAWGFVGSTTARFSNFVKGPVAAVSYLKGLLQGRESFEIGHNPAGGLMVLVMIFAVLAQVTAGLFAADTDMGLVNGPLSNLVSDKWVDRLTAFHAFWVNVLIVLVAIHVLAAFVYLAWKRQNLIGAMFTGRKPADEVAPSGSAPPALTFASGRLAVSLLIAMAALVYFIVRLG